MAKKEQLKEVSIHTDYLLWNMVSNTRNTLLTLCVYMQQETPYGDEYEAAFKEHKKLMKEFAKFEDALAKCMARKHMNKEAEKDGKK